MSSKHVTSRMITVIFFFVAGFFSTGDIDQLHCATHCESLPDPPLREMVVAVSSTAALQAEIDNAEGPKTIYLASGIYPVTSEFWILVTKPDIIIRSQTGNRDDVIIQGPGPDTREGYGIQVYESRVTIADLTIRDVGRHAIQICKTDGKQTDDLLFHNLHCASSGEQVFKSSGKAMYNNMIECSVFEYSNASDNRFSNAIDLLDAQGWIIRDNLITNSYAAPQNEKNAAPHNAQTPVAPRSHTLPAVAVTQETASLEGTLESPDAPTTYWFEFGTTPECGFATDELDNPAQNTQTSVSYDLSGLSAATVYYFRIAARNSAGTTRGTVQAFTTSSENTSTSQDGGDSGGCFIDSL